MTISSIGLFSWQRGAQIMSIGFIFGTIGEFPLGGNRCWEFPEMHWKPQHTERHHKQHKTIFTHLLSLVFKSNMLIDYSISKIVRQLVFWFVILVSIFFSLSARCMNPNIRDRCCSCPDWQNIISHKSYHPVTVDAAVAAAHFVAFHPLVSVPLIKPPILHPGVRSSAVSLVNQVIRVAVMSRQKDSPQLCRQAALPGHNEIIHQGAVSLWEGKGSLCIN